MNSKREKEKRIYAAKKRFERVAMLGAFPGSPHPSIIINKGSMLGSVEISYDAQSLILKGMGLVFDSFFTGERRSDMLMMPADNSEAHITRIQEMQLRYIAQCTTETKKKKGKS